MNALVKNRNILSIKPKSVKFCYFHIFDTNHLNFTKMHLLVAGHRRNMLGELQPSKTTWP